MDNVHPGDILREDFLIGTEIPVSEVVTGTGIDAAHFAAILAGTASVDATDDLRLARYFRISEGFFIGLQIDHDLEDARRAHGDSLNSIVQRAA
ncbi:HigA family addiction module antitoxin [Novosphingobium sp. 9U]|uniref:HigA family addiction module antitoxin n=1 Tax=Novosphingobium sp. 9U TaxID=2653158 RepID=UPI001F33BBB7|nr:HigA family addiction module antitoxin [Novosphingobium sp. 9U]